MFVLSKQDNALFRGIATLLSVALVLWALGAHMQFAQAANITDVYDLLSDSAPSSPSNHTIEFVAPTEAIDGAETIVITFPTTPDSFTLGAIGQEDIDLLENGVNQAAAGWTVATTSTTITITMAGESIAAGATTTILIGTHATNEGSPNTQIVNPATSNVSYEISIAAGPSDSGHTRVAIVDNVQVTAQVNTSFTFTVTGFATAGTGVNGTSTTATTSSTAIPFGVLTAGEIETAAQRLNVSTNAINGFNVTVEQDQNLLSSTGADIDGFIEGAYTNTPAAWVRPVPTISNENSWGHWGLTSEDADLNSNEFNVGTGGDRWVSASTTPRDIFSHTGPADGVTDNIGSTTIGYQIEITSLQEAGDDYSTTLTYIATPTF